MKTLLLALTAAVLAADPTICGSKPTHPYVEYAEVACIDFDALAKLSPFFAGRGKQTQVLLHLKRGDLVGVNVGGAWKYSRVTVDQWGRLVAMVAFDGMDHQSVEVRVFEDVER
ncbi:MAG: hypothetical protein ABFD89_13250 [Bryobacteraceae bacterium]